MRPHDYVYIQAWGAILSSHDYYIRDEQEKAAKDNAPTNATYFSKTENRWHTADDIIDPITRDKINELVAQINQNRSH